MFPNFCNFAYSNFNFGERTCSAAADGAGGAFSMLLAPWRAFSLFQPFLLLHHSLCPFGGLPSFGVKAKFACKRPWRWHWECSRTSWPSCYNRRFYFWPSNKRTVQYSYTSLAITGLEPPHLEEGIFDISGAYSRIKLNQQASADRQPKMLLTEKQHWVQSGNSAVFEVLLKMKQVLQYLRAFYRSRS